MPDPCAVRAFLDDRHLELAERLDAFCARAIRPLPAPPSDDEARVQARDILQLLGDEGLFRFFRPLDLRAVALTREALGAASPLADAVYAVQGLGLMSILLGASEAARRDWLDPLLRGDAMAGFAMTE